MLDYFISFDDLIESNLSDVEVLIYKTKKRHIGSLTIEELSSLTNYPNGLYLFFDNQDCLLYVGKATSRSFIERIPAHFDPREDAWFNTLPKKVMNFYNLPNYQTALEVSLSLNVVLIGIKDKTTAQKLETILRTYLKPKLNTCKGSYLSETKLKNI